VVASSGRQDLLTYTILIAAPELLPLLNRTSADGSELLIFSDTDVSRALDAINERTPAVVAIEEHFASTSRGIALINRIKSDPTLRGCELQVLARGGAFTTVPAHPEANSASLHPPPALDVRGTRRAQRYRISGPLELLVDGNPATLVDLSSLGAQVLSTPVLKPNQRVRMSLADDHGTTRFNASIVWATFEIPPKVAPRYRAGLEFLDADTRIVSGYCLKYQTG
jgi:hypothetical protein